MVLWMFVASLECRGDCDQLSFDSAGIVATPEDLQGKMECLAWVVD
jgi:hypothetical protein